MCAADLMRIKMRGMVASGHKLDSPINPRRSTMFKHILVPVDGSNTSMLAVSKAAGLAKTFGSAVTAVYVVDPYPFTGVGADFAYGQAQYINAATSEANAALEATRKAMAEA
eukprot:gene6328-8059_t